jgi:hypothetical protein
MKPFFTLVALTLTHLFANAQDYAWTKNDRNLIYEECLSILSSEYKTLTIDQKETISLCYLGEITSKYSKNDYQSKIDAELKRIRSAAIIQCAKNLGVDLAKPAVQIEEKKPEPPKVDYSKPSKENLIGQWKDEESEFWLFETGDFKMVRMDGSSSKGTWKIDGDVLTLYHDKLFGTSQKDFKILMFSQAKFVYQSTKNRRDTFTVERIK